MNYLNKTILKTYLEQNNLQNNTHLNIYKQREPSCMLNRDIPK